MKICGTEITIGTKEELDDQYELLEVIAKGSTCTMRRCRHKSSGTVFACKVQNCQSKARRTAMKSEAKSYQALKHEHVVDLRGVYEVDNSIYMIFEFADLGSVIDMICDHFPSGLPETLCASIVKDVALAIQCCNHQRVAHRDVKPDNILLFSTHGDTSRSSNMCAKLGDFGFAKALTGEDDRFWNCVGTPEYVAPEVLDEDSGYGLECDMWSLGVSLYVMLSGRVPFYGSSLSSIYAKIEKCEYAFDERFFADVSPAAKDLVWSLLQSDPEDRLSVDEVLQHPWITNGSTLLWSHSSPISPVSATAASMLPSIASVTECRSSDDHSGLDSPLSKGPHGPAADHRLSLEALIVQLGGLNVRTPACSPSELTLPSGFQTPLATSLDPSRAMGSLNGCLLATPLPNMEGSHRDSKTVSP